jgi:hypothetical protein
MFAYLTLLFDAARARRVPAPGPPRAGAPADRVGEAA